MSVALWGIYLYEAIDWIEISYYNHTQVNYEANGWVLHQVTDIWAKTSPDRGQAVWALWPMGGAWLCTHLWEHYTYTMDRVSYLGLLIFFILYSSVGLI